MFWVVKILATTLGETGGDAVSMSMDLGYLVGTAIFAAIFVVAVMFQIAAKKFHPGVYWATIIATTTVGTTMADYADRWHGKVGDRGRRHGEAQSRLLLIGLPRGSFGLELARAENDDLFVDGELADTLAHVTRLVDAAARSDEDFAAELNESAPRVVQNLRSFLEVIAKGKAGLRLESGDYRCEMTPVQANGAFIRVAETTASDETVRVSGILKGVLLESWEFDFSSDDAMLKSSLAKFLTA